MREITVVSGKGGTGKTSLTAAFAHLAKNPVICDLDVDAPDLHLLLAPRIIESQPFEGGREAVIDPETCRGCGSCVEYCQFGALVPTERGYAVDPTLCEGCGVCAHFCPSDAIAMHPKTAGLRHRSHTMVGPMLHSELYPGAENSGLLVSALRQEARSVALAEGRDLILADGPPGIGCPVISALTGTTLAVIVTEPTPSGRHDLERIADLCRHFRRPAAVIVNKADLDPGVSAEIGRFSEERGYPVIARLPFSPAVVDALVEGRCLAEVTADGIADEVRRAWEAIDLLAERPGITHSTH